MELVDQLGEGFVPVLDKHFIQEHPVALYTRGEYQRVPAVIGYNSHEGMMFVFGQGASRNVFYSVEEAQLSVKTLIMDYAFRNDTNSAKVPVHVFLAFHISLILSWGDSSRHILEMI